MCIYINSSFVIVGCLNTADYCSSHYTNLSSCFPHWHLSLIRPCVMFLALSSFGCLLSPPVPEVHLNNWKLLRDGKGEMKSGSQEERRREEA